MEVFNINFVAEVEKYPQLYNYTLKEYSKRDETEKAWKQVATAMKMSVNECKEKWRNLRSTFAKNIKQKPSGSGISKKRPYYLMGAMQFALPFIKVAGNPSGSLPQDMQPRPLSPASEVDVAQEEETHSTEEFAFSEIGSPEIATPATASPLPGPSRDPTTPGRDTRGPTGHPVRKRKSGRTQGDAEQAFIEYIAAKKAKVAPKESSSREEGIKHFLMSLMPDLIQMKDTQLRQFKRKTLQLVEEILETPSEQFVPPQSYPYSAGFPYSVPPASQQPSEQGHF